MNNPHSSSPGADLSTGEGFALNTLPEPIWCKDAWRLPLHHQSGSNFESCGIGELIVDDFASWDIGIRANVDGAASPFRISLATARDIIDGLGGYKDCSSFHHATGRGLIEFDNALEVWTLTFTNRAVEAQITLVAPACELFVLSLQAMVHRSMELSAQSALATLACRDTLRRGARTQVKLAPDGSYYVDAEPV